MMGCLEVFDSVKATISPDFVDSIPPDIEKMKFVEEVAIKVGLEVVLDFENIIFVGSFKSISEGRKCFLNYMDRWYELKETLRCVDKELDESSCTASKLENEYSVLSVEESLETKDITESELYMDDANAIYEQDTSMNNEHLQLTQLNISFRDTFDEHQALDTSQSNLLDNTLLDQCNIISEVSSENEHNDLELDNNNRFDKLCGIFQLDEICKKKDLSDRKRKYEENLPYKYCTMCSFKTKRQSHYSKHLLLHQKTSEIHQCTECEFKALRASTLRRHQLVHFATELFCQHCRYKTHSNKALLKHISSKHPITENPGSVQEKLKKRCHLKKIKTPLQCSSCMYECFTKSRLKRHEKEVHNEERPYMCDTCGFMFKRADTLQQHKSLHSGDPKYVCHCGKQCRSMSHLLQHKSVHSHLRPYLCETCGISFKTRSIQRKHQRNKHKEDNS